MWNGENKFWILVVDDQETKQKNTERRSSECLDKQILEWLVVVSEIVFAYKYKTTYVLACSHAGQREIISKYLIESVPGRALISN